MRNIEQLVDLTGRTALVTGASSGLGRASAEMLALAGADTAIISRDQARIDAAAAEIAGRVEGRVLPIAADIRESGDIERMAAATAERLGHPDILVVSGGGPKPGGFTELTDEDWRASFELLFLSTVRLIRAVLPGMKEKGEGRIIVTLSSGVKQPIPNLMLSNAIRAGVVGLLKSLATELAPQGILVNGVIPGRIATERVRTLDENAAERQGLTPAEIKAKSQNAIPMKRYGEPSEFGRAVLFLASGLSTYTTGSLLEVDGGRINTLL